MSKMDVTLITRIIYTTLAFKERLILAYIDQ